VTDTPQAAAEAATLIPDPALTAAPPAEVVKTEEEIWGEIQAGKEQSPAPADAPPSEAAGESTGDPAPAPAADPASPATAVPAADLWATATPEQKAAYEILQASEAEKDRRLRRSFGKISALSRKINAAEASAKENRHEAKSRDEIAPLGNDYPEIAQPLTKALDTIDNRLDHLSKAEKSSLEADQRELKELVDVETETLIKAHPDYATVLKENSAAFATWIEDQPRSIREAGYRNANFIADSDGAIKVVEGFKTHLGHVTAPAPTPAPQPSLDDRRQRQIAASASPQRSGGRATVSGIPAEGDEEAIWNAIQAQKERARA